MVSRLMRGRPTFCLRDSLCMSSDAAFDEGGSCRVGRKDD